MFCELKSLFVKQFFATAAYEKNWTKNGFLPPDYVMAAIFWIFDKGSILRKVYKLVNSTLSLVPYSQVIVKFQYYETFLLVLV